MLGLFSVNMKPPIDLWVIWSLSVLHWSTRTPRPLTFIITLLSRFTKGNESKNRPELPDDCVNFTVWVEWTFSGWLTAVRWGHGANLTRNSMNKHSEPRWPVHNWGWSSAGDAARGSICDKRSTDSPKMFVSSDENWIFSVFNFKDMFPSQSAQKLLALNDSMKASSHMTGQQNCCVLLCFEWSSLKIYIK